MLLFAAAALSFPGAPAPAAVDAKGVEISTPVQQSLRRLREGWEQWTQLYLQDDREGAEAILDDLLSTAESLGLPRLPDLGIAAATYGVRAGRAGDMERAQWAIDAARRLDPDRPEIEFALARILRIRGDYPGMLFALVGGYGRLFGMPLERSVWLQNALLWLFFVVMLSGGLFLALLMATKGGDVLYDVRRVVAPPLPRLAGTVVAVILLLWPLLLPWGLFWLVAYWTMLLWGYGSRSERVVLCGVLILVGVTPFLLAIQERYVEVALSPPMRAIENLEAGRIYGTLFSDLQVLASALPDEPAVTELFADIHRRFNQWEQARLLYVQIKENEPDNTAVRNNLGVYYHRSGDYAQAINHFQEAISIDPTRSEALFNLSQAYSQSYAFDKSGEALEQARVVDSRQVDDWMEASADQVVPINGGRQRLADVRRQLIATWGGDDATRIASSRRYLTLAAAFAVLLLAVTLHLVRRQLGYAIGSLDDDHGESNRWLKALVPGLASAERGRGIRAFLALFIPVALALLIFSRGLGYQVPVAYAPGVMIATVCGSAGLILFLVLRLGQTLAD